MRVSKRVRERGKRSREKERVERTGEKERCLVGNLVRFS